MNRTSPAHTVPLPQLYTIEADITIAGLGPGPVDAIPLGVWRALHSGRQVILRTRHHPCAATLEQSLPDLASCDDLYETHDRFEDVYAAIVERITAAAQKAPLVYAVPGHPWVGEATTPLLRDAARQADLTTRVIGGASFVEAAFGAMGVDLMDGAQVVDAMLLAQRHHPPTDVSLPALVGQIYARHVASDVKLTLLNAYPPEHPVTLVHAAGTGAERTETVPLHELDRRDDFDHLTSLFVPSLPHASYNELQEVMAHLRAPNGCPWDQVQTLKTVRAYLLDETSEVLEAMDAGDDPHIAEELGDLLGIVAMTVQIATEEGRFQMAEAVRHSVEKLIRRHPHVFGDADVEDMADLYRQWDAIKAQERAAQGKPPPGPLDEIPAALPALKKAQEMQSRARKVGWLDRAALAVENPDLAALLPEGSTETDLGRLLWQLVALAQERGWEPEDALRAYTVHFRDEPRG